MRRSTAVVVTLTLVASALALASSASAEPYSGTETGVLSARPSTFTAGQPIELLANFPSDQASKVIEFFEETSEGDFAPLGTDAANDLGNAYFKPVTVDAEQDFFARTPDGKVTQLLTLTPTVVHPDNYPEGGTLTMNPATAHDGDIVYFLANFPSGTFDVTLYEEKTAGVWSAIGVDRTNTSGNAYFHDFEVTGTRNVFALATTGKRTEVDTVTPTPEVTLSIQRDCTGNDCGATATASGVTNPAQAGRTFRLEYLSGTTYTPIGDPATSDAAGKVTIPFGLSSFSQWTARSFRLTSAADSSGPALTSNVIKFMPGPTELGKNVLRVNVEDGVFPTKKGPEYGATATASQDGVVDPVINNYKVEDFGVRGTSTAGYTKKPYKLKFDKSPKDTTVFGMGADKSWTLLASFLDQTFVRDKVGLGLGRRINEDGRWTPDSRFVELFVNDQYRGSYLMTESVKIDGDRVNVSSKTGMIMEVDNALSSAIDFMSTIGEIVFAFKDPDERKTLADGTVDPEGVTGAKVTAVKNRINAFEKKLYSSSGRDEYEDFINEEAAIDFMFIKEFTKDNDADFNSSHYFSWDSVAVVDPTKPLRDGKFHFGPAWDFDRSAGNVDPDTAGHKYVSGTSGWMLRGTGTPSDSGRQLYRTHWFVQLFKDAGFNAAVKARWAVVKDEFKKVGDSEVATLKAEIGVGALNDRNRWASEPKRYRSHGSYNSEIAWVTDWYQKRYTWMNGQLS